MTGAGPRQPERSAQAAFAERFPEPSPGSVTRATAGQQALPRILYIAGLPRSGTTVLGYVLGGIPDAIFVGELAFFWRRFAEDRLCSCGMPLPSCPFWSAVVKQAFGEMTRKRAHELNSLEQAVFGREWPLALAPLQWPARKSRRIGVMLAERARLYRAIAEVARAACVVDCGKEPIYGSIVARIGGADFSTVHIVRDPRGVAFSWQKRVRSDSEPRDMPQRSPTISALRWVRQNLIIQFSLQRLGNAYVRVRYENLVQRPAEVRKAVADATSVTRRHGHSPTAPALVAGQHHWVSGNPGVRRHLSEGLRLTLDEQWRAGMPHGQRWLVTSACSVLMAVYGYGLRSGSASTRIDESHTGVASR